MSTNASGRGTAGDGNGDGSDFSHSKSMRTPKLSIHLPTNEEGNIDNISPLSGLMSLGERKGFDVDVYLVPESSKDAEDAERYRRIMERHGQNLEWADKYASKHVSHGILQDMAEYSGAYDRWAEEEALEASKPHLEVVADSDDTDQSVESDEEPAGEETVPELATDLSPPVKICDCFDTKQAARKLFGSSSKAAQRMVYNRRHRGDLETMQFNGKNSKVRYTKKSVYALKEKLDAV